MHEVLSERAEAAPTSAASSAALDAREAVAEQAAEAQLVKTGGSLIDPSRIMLKDKLAFVLGERGGWPGRMLLFPSFGRSNWDGCGLAAGLPLPHASLPTNPPSPSAAASLATTPAGVTNVFITAFWIGRWPQTYHW